MTLGHVCVVEMKPPGGGRTHEGEVQGLEGTLKPVLDSCRWIIRPGESKPAHHDHLPATVP